MPITLTNSTTPVTAGYNMLDDGDNTYWFHHKPSFPDAHPLYYHNLISNANISIQIWDPYFHPNIDNIVFSNIRNNVSIQILSLKSIQGAGLRYMDEVKQAIKEVIPSSKNVSFWIGVIDKFTKGTWNFHDRFLIIDNTEVYLVGGSVEYNHISKMSSGIFKVHNPSTCSFIIEQFDKYWFETNKHTDSLQLLHP